MRSILPLVLVVLSSLMLPAAIVACTDDPPPKTAKNVDPTPTASDSYGQLTAIPKVEKEDLVVGTGVEAKAGSAVKVDYTGTLIDGTKFDSSKDRGTPFSFVIGSGQVIKGWEQGVVGMKVGGRRKLTIPSELGYGREGRPPTIPPNATLVFDIELLFVVE
ncbi:MAG: FKBP-type peptidyl-prolyl cis-trans isomerase [Polyangiales bacterium]